METSLRESTSADLAYMAGHAREIDRREAYYQTGLDLVNALTYAMDQSDLHCYTGLLEDRPVVMFGVALTDPFEMAGVPWLVGTSELDKVQTRFLRMNRPVLGEMVASYNALENVVYSENRTAINWLRWLGFELDAPAPYGPYNKLFHAFRWRYEDGQHAESSEEREEQASVYARGEAGAAADVREPEDGSGAYRHGHAEPESVVPQKLGEASCAS